MPEPDAANDALIVYGRAFSPFTRRVLIWAQLQGRSIEHRPIQVMGDDFERLKALTSAGRVPVVQLPDGRTLIESWAICDWLESTAAPGERLLPEAPEPRAAATQAIAWGHAATEKAVALVYETQRRPDGKTWPDWADRLRGQARGAMETLAAQAPETGFFGGDAPNGADVVSVVLVDFVAAALGDALGPPPPALAELAARAADIPAFADTNPAPR